MMRCRSLEPLAAALAAPFAARAAWPARPVTVIVPDPPGGTNDILAIAPHLFASLPCDPAVAEAAMTAHLEGPRERLVP